jgi:toxin-antitoxin system PIN domain toxin
MISVDTNLLVYAQDVRSPRHGGARSFLLAHAGNRHFALSEFVLVELYCVLRSPAVLARPLDSVRAVEIVQRYRSNPMWNIIEYPVPVMGRVWAKASDPLFARRRIFDVRLAFGLRAAGVTEFATVNTDDFADLGFDRVWNPLDD